MHRPLLDARAITALTDPSDVRVVAPMDVVVREGDPCEGLFVVGAGSLVATICLGRSTTIVDTLEPGDVFGEIPAHPLDRTTHIATITALRASRLAVISPDLIETLCREHPDVRAALEALLDDHRRRRMHALSAP